MTSQELAHLALLQPGDFKTVVTKAGGRVDFIFGDDRPFAHCHASTVAQTNDGTLVSAWFGGAHEKADNVGIWMSRYIDGNWTAPVEVAKVNNTPHWNPALLNDPSRGLFLFFKVGSEIAFWQTYWMHSEDNGATWSKPVELVPGDKGGRGPVKDKPIILSDGAWLAGASTEYKGWHPFADRSEDGGKTWTRSADFAIDRQVVSGRGGIQPTLWEAPKGHVHALLRTAAGRIARTDSTDYGRTWCPVYLTDLPNNNSGIDVVRLDDGRLFLAYNPIGKNWGNRTPLTLAVSLDNGATWKNLANLESGQGEYSYPAIIQTKTGIAVTYTWKRERIRCWQIPLAALERAK